MIIKFDNGFWSIFNKHTKMEVSGFYGCRYEHYTKNAENKKCITRDLSGMEKYENIGKANTLISLKKNGVVQNKSYYDKSREITIYYEKRENKEVWTYLKGDGEKLFKKVKIKGGVKRIYFYDNEETLIKKITTKNGKKKVRRYRKR